MSEQEYSAKRPPAEAPAPRERKRGKGGGINPDAWMVTFSDLLNLLMTFFVLIFASQDPVPPETLFQAFGQSAGVFGLYRTGFLQTIGVVPRHDVSEDLVQVFLDEIGALDIKVQQQERGLVITLPTDAYFQPGSAALNKRAIERIDKLAQFLRDTRHFIRVEGFTDDREPVRPPYTDLWDLSVGRADAVLERLLHDGLDARRLSLVGYGPSHPRFNNVSRLGRQRNRRVEIVILNRPAHNP